MAGEPDDGFKAVIVSMILDSKPEAAIEALSKRYGVETPRLGVGVFERHSKGVRAVYSHERREILAANRDFLYDPFVILHEFYHHIRSVGGKHRGTEKNADRFAVDYILAFNRIATRLRGRKQA